MKLMGKPKYSLGGKTCPSATLSTTNPTLTDMGSNDFCNERPVTSCQCCGTAVCRNFAKSYCSLGHSDRLLLVLSCGMLIPLVVLCVCVCVRTRALARMHTHMYVIAIFCTVSKM
jgi:hypothetical protein